jgi:hypothetical protein
MIAKLGAAALMLLVSIPWTCAGPPEGRYRVTGNNPGGGSEYSGTVTVERTGETFRVIWQIGSQTFTGTGIGGDKGLAVAYRSNEFSGLAIYGVDGDDWDGVWMVTDGRTLGTEKWRRE